MSVYREVIGSFNQTANSADNGDVESQMKCYGMGNLFKLNWNQFKLNL